MDNIVYKIKKPRRRRRRFFAIAAVLLIPVVLMLAFSFLDERFLPTVIEVASLESKNTINRAVNQATRVVSEAMDLRSGDFYFKSVDENGKLEALTVNTVLVNEVCVLLSEELTESFHEVQYQEISVPLGTILGIKSLANMGPKYPFTVMPVGEAIVDYESSFTSAGINQVNFQIWLNIEATMKIANPLQSQTIVITRKVPLVNTIINGEVPSIYKY